MIGCHKKAELRLLSGAADRGVDSNAVATQLIFHNRFYGEALPSDDTKALYTSRTHVFSTRHTLLVHQAQ